MCINVIVRCGQWNIGHRPLVSIVSCAATFIFLQFYLKPFVQISFFSFLLQALFVWCFPLWPCGVHCNIC